MKTPILKYFKQYITESNDCLYVNSILVTAYVIINNLKIKNNRYLKSFILGNTNEDLQKFVKTIRDKHISFSLEDLMEIFEFVISPKEKEVNGAVYTPRYIRDYIINTVLQKCSSLQSTKFKYGDISCGCGGFLLDISRILHVRGRSYAEIFSENIFGVDIQQYSIDRTKIILSLLALSDGEDIDEYTFHLYQGNSLSFDWRQDEIIAKNKGFDVIIGNPPYVSASKMDEESRSLAKIWSVSLSGKTDLYIPFFQIALENLKEEGILGYITVNNFYRSVNGRNLRQYLIEKKWDLQIIDFGAEKIFPGRSAYTCLFFACKHFCDSISYTKAHPLQIRDKEILNYIRVPYTNYKDNEIWQLKSERIQYEITKIEHTGIPLQKMYQIKNGLATLKNNVYIIDVLDEDNRFYYFQKSGEKYKVEKDICREIVKGNILRCEKDLNKYSQQIIFPYKDSPNGKILITETEIKRMYPFAYRYLKAYRSLLINRDKGKRDYGVWYAFGRTQALNINGKKLLCPYIADKPYFILSEKEDLLFYNGYAILSHSAEDLLILKKILSSSVFWFYIQETSKPYGGKFYSLAKNYMGKFGVPILTLSQKSTILKLEGLPLDKYIQELYRVNIEDMINLMTALC